MRVYKMTTKNESTNNTVYSDWNRRSNEWKGLYKINKGIQISEGNFQKVRNRWRKKKGKKEHQYLSNEVMMSE